MDDLDIPFVPSEDWIEGLDDWCKDAKRTVCGVNRLRNEYTDRIEFNHGVPIYKGKRTGYRTVIGRDTTLNGGVYIGGRSREVIVADFDDIIKGFYNSLEDYSPKAVFEAVKENMRYDNDKVHRILKREKDAQGAREPEIKISTFLAERTGVCRHMGLLAALIMDRAIQEGKLEGQVSVDRGYLLDSVHAWCRYTDGEGQVWIIDPAQNHFSTLDKVMRLPLYMRATDKDYARNGRKDMRKEDMQGTVDVSMPRTGERHGVPEEFIKESLEASEEDKLPEDYALKPGDPKPKVRLNFSRLKGYHSDPIPHEDSHPEMAIKREELEKDEDFRKASENYRKRSEELERMERDRKFKEGLKKYCEKFEGTEEKVKENKPVDESICIEDIDGLSPQEYIERESKKKKDDGTRLAI